MRLENFLAEACANFAYSLELLGIGIVAGEKKRAINICAFAFAIVASDDHKIKRVSNTSKVVFFELRDGE